MFADRVRIHVAAGRGGDGSRSFRREAHVPRGGPDGGDGGRGGDVIMVAEGGLTSLADLRRGPHVRAEAGGPGAGSRAHGANAPHRTIVVPPGTVAVTDPEGEWLGEVVSPGDTLVLARGGRGGRGNVHFVSPTHRAPRHAEKGDPGEARWIRLELKTIADIGLVGAPNAGKSTLLAALTEARPEVAAYPFTTLSPNLGVLEAEPDATGPSILIADVPGLIEGAHAGHGLGHEFLRHVERTRALVGVIDGAADDPVGDWLAVLEELHLHDPGLVDRPRRVVVTKQDLAAVHDAWPGVRRALEKRGERPHAVSAHDGSGLDALRRELTALLDQAAAIEASAPREEPMAVHRFDAERDGWQVVAEGTGLRVRGRAIERAAARIDFDNEESRERFQRRLERMGIDAALREHGARPGTAVHIGPLELVWGDE